LAISLSYLTNLFFTSHVVVGSAVDGLNPTSLDESGCGRGKKREMRHPQRLEISFLGTQIRAEGIIGILGTIMIISVIFVVYFRS
jgi:hypothetical protein